MDMPSRFKDVTCCIEEEALWPFTSNLFQAIAILVLFYDSTTWTLTKQLQKNLNNIYTRMLHVALNLFWKQLYGHLPHLGEKNKIYGTFLKK